MMAVTEHDGSINNLKTRLLVTGTN